MGQSHRSHPADDRLRSSLAEAGWCYELPSGLYFDTSLDEDYGKLARLNVEGQREGARVDAVEGKRSPADFAVWRTAASDDNRQMEWSSPWGVGAPGWHLECSAMSLEHLGRHFDIHTGGVDHIPVHHTNEIAQSEALLADGEDWVGWWLHGEFINLRGAKISKSTGGGVLVDDLVDRGHHPLVYRYLLLQAHYRSQIEFSWEAMDSARTGLRRLLERYSSVRIAPAAELGPVASGYLDAFDGAISDDLNTARALAVVATASRDDALLASRAVVACPQVRRGPCHRTREQVAGRSRREAIRHLGHTGGRRGTRRRTRDRVSRT